MRLLVALPLLLTYGCPTTVHVQRPVTTDAVHRIAPVLQGEDATLVYVQPRGLDERNCADISVTSENVLWVRSNGERVVAPIDAVREISICEPGCRQKGALIGMAVGAAVGAGLTALVFTTCESARPDGSCGLWWIAGPAVGTIVGALIGAHGTRTTVEFERAAAIK